MSTIRTIDRELAGIESARPAGGFLAFLTSVALVIQEMTERNRTRRALSALSDAELKDIGLSRADAYREAHRPFWD